MSDNESSKSFNSVDSFGIAPPAPRNTRGERRARRMLLRNSKKFLGEVSRVVFRLADDSLYAIDKPDVYKNPNLNTYLVFGALNEVQSDYDEIQDYKIRQAANELQQQISGLTITNSVESVVAARSEESVGTEAIDETGLNGLDIELVMSQALVTRSKAVSALRANSNDLVNTIMALIY